MTMFTERRAKNGHVVKVSEAQIEADLVNVMQRHSGSLGGEFTITNLGRGPQKSKHPSPPPASPCFS